MKIFIIAGARPNFMKISPIIEELKKHPHITYKLIHTWQHFDKNMSDAFFEDLSLPYPDVNLGVHLGSVSNMTWRTMIEFDELIKNELPDYVLVVWDVNATIACSFVAKQNGVKVIHVEAWLRSFDSTMPEEINRVLTDHISDFLFVTENSGMVNLKNEWVTSWVYFVWNVMIDTLMQNKHIFERGSKAKDLWLAWKKYALITIHRPSNVDRRENLEKLLVNFRKLSEKITLVLPLHPRTKWSIEKFGLESILQSPNIIILDALWYLDFMNLVIHATCVLTDSGWIQEETTYLEIPCLTMRENTERPVTVEIGSNTLVWSDFDLIDQHISDILSWKYKKWRIPDLWDGKTSKRILEYIQ